MDGTPRETPGQSQISHRMLQAMAFSFGGLAILGCDELCSEKPEGRPGSSALAQGQVPCGRSCHQGDLTMPSNSSR